MVLNPVDRHPERSAAKSKDLNPVKVNFFIRAQQLALYEVEMQRVIELGVFEVYVGDIEKRVEIL